MKDFKEKPYNKSHKIFNCWQDIQKLIALENQLIRDIEFLRKEVHSLQQQANTIRTEIKN